MRGRLSARVSKAGDRAVCAPDTVRLKRCAATPADVRVATFPRFRMLRPPSEPAPVRAEALLFRVRPLPNRRSALKASFIRYQRMPSAPAFDRVQRNAYGFRDLRHAEPLLVKLCDRGCLFLCHVEHLP